MLFSIHYVTKIHLCCYMQFTHFHYYKNLHFVKILFIYPFFTLRAFDLFPNCAAVNTFSCPNTYHLSHYCSGYVMLSDLYFWKGDNDNNMMMTADTCLMLILLQNTFINMIELTNSRHRSAYRRVGKWLNPGPLGLIQRIILIHFWISGLNYHLCPCKD